MCIKSPYPTPEHGSLGFKSEAGSKTITGSGDHGSQGFGALCIRIPLRLPLLYNKSQRVRKLFHRTESSPTSPAHNKGAASSSLTLHSIPPAKNSTE